MQWTFVGLVRPVMNDFGEFWRPFPTQTQRAADT
jgi:hypothetical protein